MNENNRICDPLPSPSVEMSENSSSDPGFSALEDAQTLTICPEGDETAGGKEAEKYRWVIHPRSRVRHYYLMFMVILTFVNLITIPLDMAFSDDMRGDAHKYWVIFNVFSDVMFCLDVGINFQMGIFSDDGQAILDPKLIRLDYLKSWLVPDVVAAFPVDIIIIIVEYFYHADTDVLMASKLVRILMFVRIFSMIRLLRVPKLLRFCFELESVSDIQLEEVKKFFRVFFMFMLIILVWHWNTCLQYFLSLLEEFPDDCWVMQENIKNGTIGAKYSYASFRAFYQLSWVLSEYQSPTRIAERWMSVVTMVVGRIMCFALITCLIGTVGSMSATTNEYKKKMSQLQSSKMFKKLPRLLRQRTTAQFKWQYDKRNILDLVSKRLRKDIIADMCPNLLSKRSIFLKHDREFTEAILVNLEYELFQAGDVIIHQDAKANHMLFFIEHGRVLVKNKFVNMELSDGDQFGEISFLFGGKQLASISALSACSVFSLSSKHFEGIEAEFPHVVEELRAAALHLKDDLEGHNNKPTPNQADQVTRANELDQVCR